MGNDGDKYDSYEIMSYEQEDMSYTSDENDIKFAETAEAIDNYINSIAVNKPEIKEQIANREFDKVLESLNKGDWFKQTSESFGKENTVDILKEKANDISIYVLEIKEEMGMHPFLTPTDAAVINEAYKKVFKEDGNQTERERAAAEQKRRTEIDKEVKREMREDKKKVRERIRAERKADKGPGALDKLKRMLFPQNYREYKTIADRDPTKPEYSENQRTYGYMQFFRKTGFCNDENASEPYRGRLDIESVPITDRLIMKNSPRFDWHIARRIAFTPQERQEYLSFNGKVPFIEKVKIVAEHFLNPKNLLGFGEAPTEVYKKKGESAEKERTQNQEIQEDNATNKAVERKRLEMLEKRFGEEARRKLEREYGEDISRNRGGFGRGR